MAIVNTQISTWLPYRHAVELAYDELPLVDTLLSPADPGTEAWH
jgi:hypothetical protein